MDRKEAQAYLESKGVEFDKRWGLKRLTSLIEEVDGVDLAIKMEDGKKEIIEDTEDYSPEPVKETGNYTLTNKAGVIKFEGVKDLRQAEYLRDTYGLTIN
jgi:hypothetical protein